jgi:hypothetical protein
MSAPALGRCRAVHPHFKEIVMKAKTLTAALLSCSLLLTGATVFAADAMAKTHSTKHVKKAGAKTPVTKTAPAPKDDAAK